MPSEVSMEQIVETVNRAVHEALPKALEGMPQVRAEYLSTEDAATYIGLSSFQLEQWRSQGGGPEFVKLSRLVRYPRKRLDEFMMSRLRDHTS